MLRFNLIVLVITISELHLIKGRNNKDGVHLFLKNVNYLPYRNKMETKYNVLDFSIYLPKKKEQKKPTIESKPSAYHNHDVVYGTIKQPSIRNFQSKDPKIPSHGQAMVTAPFFEMLSGLVPQKLRAPHNTPFYGLPTSAPIQNNNNNNNYSPFSIKLPKYSSSFSIQKPIQSTSSIYYHTTVPTPINVPERFESKGNQHASHNTALSVFKYFGRNVPEATSNPSTLQNPHFEAYTDFRTDPKNIYVKHPKFYETLTAHDERFLPNLQNYNSNHQNYNDVNLNKNLYNGEELIHEPSVNGILHNSVVYHDDRYSNPKVRIQDDGEDDGIDKGGYRVNEDIQESKKSYQKKKPTSTILPFLINVQNISMESEKNYNKNQNKVITPRPVVSDFSVISSIPLSDTTPKKSLIENKMRESSPRKSPTTKAIADEIKYYQYANALGPGSYNAGVKKGNLIHGIESHERSVKDMGLFQKRVRWTDKNGGYGEHYWDLGHSKKAS